MDEEGMEGEEGRREGGRERGMGTEGRVEGGREGGRVGGTEKGKGGRRMGTRAKPHICIHLLNPHWTTPRQAVISTQQHKLSN